MNRHGRNKLNEGKQKVIRNSDTTAPSFSSQIPFIPHCSPGLEENFHSILLPLCLLLLSAAVNFQLV
nr:hypothetical protein CFP56_05117 [Quercus suber]